MKVDDKLLKRSLTAALDFSVYQKEGFKPKVRKFDESIDLIINLKDINLNDPKMRIDQELILPNDVIAEKIPKVCVVANEEFLVEAKKLGVDMLDSQGMEKLNAQEKKYKKKFVKKYDYFVVEDKMMKDVAKYLARFLGPVGKMPKPYPTGYGIVTNREDLKNSIERYKKVVRVQLKKLPMIQIKLGKKSMDSNKVLENVKAVVEYVSNAMPHKLNNLRSIYIKTTMGKPIKVEERFLGGIKK